MASARETSRSSGSSTERALRVRAAWIAAARFALCVDPAEHVDLEARKVYRVKPDVDGAAHGLVRVIDESGEDYLYPARLFVPVQVSDRDARVLRKLTTGQV